MGRSKDNGVFFRVRQGSYEQIRGIRCHPWSGRVRAPWLFRSSSIDDRSWVPGRVGHGPTGDEVLGLSLATGANLLELTEHRRSPESTYAVLDPEQEARRPGG